MGLFATLAYSDGRWTRGRPTAVPFLLVDVHDGDVATVDYRFADASGGRFYLGWEPRIYFDEPDAATAGRRRRGGRRLRPLGARRRRGRRRPGRRPAADGRPGRRPPPPDVPVVTTVDRLVALAGLPPVDWPTDDDAPAG